MISRPLYLNKIEPYIDKPFIKVLVGMRRTGKSTLLEAVKEILLKKGVSPEKIIHINFESLDYVNVRTKLDFTNLIKNVLDGEGRHYLLLDEPQNIEGWDEVVNAVLADNSADIYLTGSNSKLLSSELSTHLTGRFVNVHVYPLNFREYLDFKTARGLTLSDLSVEFENYLKIGGFPVLHASDYSESQGDNIVSDIYSSTIFRDLIERKNIRNTELLRRVVKYIFDNIGNIFSAQSIVEFLKNEYRKVDVETIYNYLDALEETFVITRIPRYDLRGKNILKTHEKFFLGDIGLLYAVNGRNLSCIPGILENIVLNELLSHDFSVYIGKNDQKEIDFVAEKDHKRIYIQVATTLSNADTASREFSAFENISDNYPKYILTLDKSWSENRDGIEQKFLPEFILENLS